MIRLSFRGISTTRAALSKTTSTRIIIPPASHFKNKDRQSSRIPRHEYSQLPEDSNYIEKFYDELAIFSDEILEKQLKKCYADFDNDPDELVFQLEKYIELQVIPKHSEYKDTSLPNAESHHVQSIKCKTLSDKIIVERFLDFARSVKLTLMLNGGHSFIFDVMLQAKSVFDEMHKTKV